MASASRTRPATRSSPPSLLALRVRDAAGTWLLPVVAAVVGLVAAGLGATEVVARPPALAVAVVAALVVVLFIGLQPLLAPGTSGRTRLLGLAVAAIWLGATYLPFHVRLFPGMALMAPVEVTAAGGGLPVRIPSDGRHAVDLVLVGRLTPPPDGGTAPPVHYAITVTDAAGQAHAFAGTFEDRLRSRRLGRRGSAVVHQVHGSTWHVVPNPAGADLTLSHVALEPDTAPPITVTAYPHRLPGPLGLGLAAAVLLGAVLAFDALGPVASADGALTLGTAAVLGAATIFATGDAVQPDFQTLIGAVIFGGPLGFAAGGALWWVTKRVRGRPA